MPGKAIRAVAADVLAASAPCQMVQLGKYQETTLSIGIIMLAIGDRLLMLLLISFGGTHEGESNLGKRKHSRG